MNKLNYILKKLGYAGIKKTWSVTNIYGEIYQNITFSCKNNFDYYGFVDNYGNFKVHNFYDFNINQKYNEFKFKEQLNKIIND